MIVRGVLFLVMAAAIAGCAPSYHCNKYPLGSCKNMTQVYNDTGSGFKDYRDEQPTDKKAAKNGKLIKPIVIGSTVKGLNELQPGDPVLTKPQVIRVWVAPWEDKDRDLNYSYMYLRTKDSEWTGLK